MSKQREERTEKIGSVLEKSTAKERSNREKEIENETQPKILGVPAGLFLLEKLLLVLLFAMLGAVAAFLHKG